jgi:hypothetical protein
MKADKDFCTKAMSAQLLSEEIIKQLTHREKKSAEPHAAANLLEVKTMETYFWLTSELMVIYGHIAHSKSSLDVEHATEL